MAELTISCFQPNLTGQPFRSASPPHRVLLRFTSQQQSTVAHAAIRSATVPAICTEVHVMPTGPKRSYSTEKAIVGYGNCVTPQTPQPRHIVFLAIPGQQKAIRSAAIPHAGHPAVHVTLHTHNQLEHYNSFGHGAAA